MDLMYKSFAPGLAETQRYTIQDQSTFYKSQFPKSAFNSRINNFSSRVSSISQYGTKGDANFATSPATTSRSMKQQSLQATCKEMKAEVDKAAQI